MNKIVLGSSGHIKPKDEIFKLGPLEALDIVDGFTYGFVFGEIELEQDCIDDASDIDGHTEKAFSEFTKWSENGVKRGLRELADAILAIHDTLKQCKAAGKRIVDLGKAISMIRHPIIFSYKMYAHIVVNHVEIWHELGAAREDWGERDFRNFGFQLG